MEYFHYLDDDSYESVPPGLHKTTSTSDSSANFTKKDLSRILIQGRGILSQFLFTKKMRQRLQIAIINEKPVWIQIWV